MREIFEYRRQGMSVSAISELTGHDRKTIRKYLKEGRLAGGTEVQKSGSDRASAAQGSAEVGVAPVPVYGPRLPRASKLDAFKPYLEERMTAGVWNCSVLLRELTARGYSGGHSILRDYVRPRRQGARVEAVRRFETPAGHQAQVDWGDLGSVGLLDDSGKPARRRLCVFALTLGHSRAMFAGIALEQKLATFLRLHEAAFAALGGVPREILYDRCKTVVLRELLAEADNVLDGRGEVRWHPVFLDFARYWGFTPRLCRAYRPQTKGKVESGVKFVRRNFLPGLRTLDEAGQPALRVDTVPELQRELDRWLWEVANRRRHGTTHRCVHEALDQEREHLQPVAHRAAYTLPDEALEARRVARDAFVSYGGSRYSVPWTLAGSTVRVTVVAGLLEIRHEGTAVARHALANEPHQIVQQAAHFQGMPFGSQAAPGGPTSGGKERIHLDCFEPAQAPMVQSRPLSYYEEFLYEELLEEFSLRSGDLPHAPLMTSEGGRP